MKKGIISGLWIFILFSCNNGNNQKSKQSKNDELAKNDSTAQHVDKEKVLYSIDFCTSAGSGNLIIDPYEAQRMIRHFSIYQPISPTPRKPTLPNNYWLDSCWVYAINDFLQTPIQGKKIYDGVWVTFITDASSSNKTSIYIVPTVYFQGADSNHSHHISQWGSLIPITAPCIPCSYLSFQNAPANMQQFRTIFRNEGKPSHVIDSLSRKVWIDACVFQSLAEILKSTQPKGSLPLDGISIESAAYYSKSSNPPKGQNYPYQSTIILVPTHPSGNGVHTLAWEITLQLYNYFIKKNGTAYNHGELCPNSCDD